MNIKKIAKTLTFILMLILVVVLLYVAYVFLSYKRIEDNQKIAIRNPETKELLETISFNKELSVLTYNIGFGAYSSDYSFFMDGGKYARAFDEESVLANLEGSVQLIKEHDSDFLLLQEVDLKSTRSYGINQDEILQEAFPDRSSFHGINYNSAYLMYPLLEPHGKSKSGMSTIGTYTMADGVRRSLPIDTSFYKFLDLDRCYTKTRIKVEDGNELCVYNVHLSAYTKDDSIVKSQILMLSEDLHSEYEAGNYIICGGDFNQDLLGDSPAIFGTPQLKESWAQPFPSELLPEGFKVVYDLLDEDEKKLLTPSCRNADEPYHPDTTFVTMVDGFIVSDNVVVNEVAVIDNGFLYSDHNPVRMTFQLGEDRK